MIETWYGFVRFMDVTRDETRESREGGGACIAHMAALSFQKRAEDLENPLDILSGQPPPSTPLRIPPS